MQMITRMAEPVNSGQGKNCLDFTQFDLSDYPKPEKKPKNQKIIL